MQICNIKTDYQPQDQLVTVKDSKTDVSSSSRLSECAITRSYICKCVR